MEGLSTRPNKHLPTHREIQRLKTGCRSARHGKPSVTNSGCLAGAAPLQAANAWDTVFGVVDNIQAAAP
ncbi:unnamed protein product [Clonostachys rhizophaga]|uniref:Uncharacterized protein n=1 Tax=Clonostachys rhizophaga TaxID=160324 RepID=A0A9N9W1D1_9HYPO|nr:unnamed protein product [Clonostachys rhizophaga]